MRRHFPLRGIVALALALVCLSVFFLILFLFRINFVCFVCLSGTTSVSVSVSLSLSLSLPLPLYFSPPPISLFQPQSLPSSSIPPLLHCSLSSLSPPGTPSLRSLLPSMPLPALTLRLHRLTLLPLLELSFPAPRSSIRTTTLPARCASLSPSRPRSLTFSHLLPAPSLSHHSPFIPLAATLPTALALSFTCISRSIAPFYGHPFAPTLSAQLCAFTPSPITLLLSPSLALLSSMHPPLPTPPALVSFTILLALSLILSLLSTPVPRLLPSTSLPCLSRSSLSHFTPSARSSPPHPSPIPYYLIGPLVSIFSSSLSLIPYSSFPPIPLLPLFLAALSLFLRSSPHYFSPPYPLLLSISPLPPCALSSLLTLYPYVQHCFPPLHPLDARSSPSSPLRFIPYPRVLPLCSAPSTPVPLLLSPSDPSRLITVLASGSSLSFTHHQSLSPSTPDPLTHPSSLSPPPSPPSHSLHHCLLAILTIPLLPLPPPPTACALILPHCPSPIATYSSLPLPTPHLLSLSVPHSCPPTLTPLSLLSLT
ncbi:hypothetical protein C7M84_015477 [Penaeus vannamei]|uniref:Uncharacterized protein n=1 Tax=Penaeus vannamei TaxID=6689 RepID=A0A423SQP5_PENVA|nr:hypothetical protein C7M84_015477 [Penaeus vannamei]